MPVARARAKEGPGAERAAATSVLEALDAAGAALTSLCTAMAADPDNPALKRAVDESGKAVRTLEEERDRGRSRSARR